MLTRKAGNYECNQCDFITQRKLLFEKHLIGDHGYESCQIKGLQPKFRIDKKLVNDSKIEINGKTFYQCPECDKKLYTRYTFSWHLRIHSGERPFICYICGKAFRVYQGMFRHIKETHEKSKTFPCDLCGRMFGNRRNVREHRRLHTNERPFICDVCGKSFKQQAALFVHKRSHQLTFKYKCSECNQGFRARSSMKVHMTMHTGEKPHECEICQRRFRIKHELKNHKSIHSDTFPFKCDECEQTFKQKRYLMRHCRTRHSTTDKNDDVVADRGGKTKKTKDRK